MSERRGEMQDKIDALEHELRELVRAVKRRARGEADIEGLYTYVELNYPREWRA